MSRIQLANMNCSAKREHCQDLISNCKKIDKLSEKDIARSLHAYKQKVMEEEKGNQNKNKLTKKKISDRIVPSFREVHESKQLLKSLIPDQDVNNVIKLLYKNLIQKSPEGGQSNLKLKQIEMMKDINNQKSQNRRTSMCQIDNNIKALELAGKNQALAIIKQFSKESPPYRQDPQKYQYKQLIAKSICTKDYGFSALEQQALEIGIKVSDDRERYKTTSYSIATETYRKIERFLIDDCKKKIKPIDRYQLRTIFSIILNCRKYFQENHVQTLLNFIKIVYSLENVVMTEEAAKSLYIVLQEALRTRLLRKKMNPIRDKFLEETTSEINSLKDDNLQLNKFWNIDYQRQLLEVFKRYHNFREVRQHLAKNHQQHSEAFTVQALRSKFYPILRCSLKKVNQINIQYARGKLPALIKLNDQKVGHILRSADALNLRIMLIDVYLHQNYSVNQISKVIIAINQFVTMKDKQKLRQWAHNKEDQCQIMEQQNYNDKINKKLSQQWQGKSQGKIINSNQCLGGQYSWQEESLRLDQWNFNIESDNEDLLIV